MRVQFSSGEYHVSEVSLQEVQSGLSRDYFLVTDENIAAIYPWVLDSCPCHLILPAGEETKTIKFFGVVLNWLAESGATRKSMLVAFGGGVIGDLVGFVASAYMRGVQYIQAPTTLLAQVDSSVGGKVAIDLDAGKNLAGAFYPPCRVLLSVDFLKSLPVRQIRNGMAEVLKYGFIAQPSLLAYADCDRGQNLKHVVSECLRIKADIVQRDEFETTGLRASLNFGHTIGHAIEKALNYRDLLHGEAISIGMVLEARLGERMGITASGVSEEIAEILTRAGLPTSHFVVSRSDELIQAMYRDKKALDRRLTFSLLTSLGNCKLVSGVSEEMVREVLIDA